MGLYVWCTANLVHGNLLLLCYLPTAGLSALVVSFAAFCVVASKHDGLLSVVPALLQALIHLVSVPNNSNIYNNFFLRLPCCAQRRARLGQKWCCVHFSLIMCFVLFALCTAVLAAPSTTLSEYYPEPCGFYCGIQGSPEYYYGSVPVV